MDAQPFTIWTYITWQLSQLFHLDKTDREWFITLLCPKWAQHTNDPIYVLAIGLGGTDPGRDKQNLLYHYRHIMGPSLIQTRNTNI